MFMSIRRMAAVVVVLLFGVGAGAAVAAQPAAAADNLGYDYVYSTGMTWPQTQLQSAQSVMSEVGTNFWRYFPFGSDCLSLPGVGGVCQLYFAGTSNPVRVVGRTATSFTFVSLPGHSEGADRYIRFTFFKAGADPFADIRLEAYAWGPWTASAAATIDSGLAYTFWGEFASNVGNAYR